MFFVKLNLIHVDIVPHCTSLYLSHERRSIFCENGGATSNALHPLPPCTAYSLSSSSYSTFSRLSLRWFILVSCFSLLFPLRSLTRAIRSHQPALNFASTSSSTPQPVLPLITSAIAPTKPTYRMLGSVCVVLAHRAISRLRPLCRPKSAWWLYVSPVNYCFFFRQLSDACRG